jgi:hypothetical protein
VDAELDIEGVSQENEAFKGEFVALNDDDWIEIYNYGDNATDICGVYLMDDLFQPTKWWIPDNVPSITTVAGNSFLLIWADDKTSEGSLHASFKLDASGEEIGPNL